MQDKGGNEMKLRVDTCRGKQNIQGNLCVRGASNSLAEGGEGQQVEPGEAKYALSEH